MISKDEYVLNNLFAQKAKLEEQLENADKKEVKDIENQILLVEDQIDNFGKAPKKAKKDKKAKK
jgi:hypothetical protein